MERFGYDIVDRVVRELIAARKKQKLSHEMIAEKTGLHRTTIGVIEAGKRQPTLLTCLKISHALGVDLGKIISKADQ